MHDPLAIENTPILFHHENRMKSPANYTPDEVPVSYPAECYNSIFRHWATIFGPAWYTSIIPLQWNLWRKQIRDRLFRKGYTVDEIKSASLEASDKGKHRPGESYITRIEKVILKNRLEEQRNQGPRTDGVQSMKEALQQRRAQS